MTVAFLGRIPLAMSQMGVLLLVAQATGRYGIAGATAGALAVANAAGSPFFGALADRIGQRPVVLVQSIFGSLGLVSIVFFANQGVSSVVLIVVAALTGLAMPQVGPLARVRWRPVLALRVNEGRIRKDEVDRFVDLAFSYEGAGDEASFVLGPALVGILGVLMGAEGALLAAAVLLLVFGTSFAMHRTAALVPRGSEHAPTHGVTLWTKAFVALAAAVFLMGMLFGSIQSGTTVLATDQGHPDVAGLIHAVLGIGSVMAALSLAALPASILYATRMLWASGAMVVLALPLLFVHTIPQLVAVIAVMGFAVAPYLISSFALAGLIVPPARIGTAMTFMAGATGLGYATGASIAGRAADGAFGAGGPTPAFTVTISAMAAAFLLSVATQKILRNAKLASA
ncbi:MFS transporter [Aeromicrobium duanguangcaii]|uniref:MFS transporter n=1 Tax=Aeromicrobium duanguangcaii TaxID=2968086 RepID=A0ABY5KCF8_9ACTN|nr:MFS transporter [Aeromicrobium duanguangcaii]MCD9155202.1 MFS transporter [Aeromicrobium duanguangcaii]MCL3838553.1 MFS transporter [Aeromicrobium duanguangcaii]UUI68147.1 MFS transporter [Aeromicrobium duanguangcaii]